MLCYVIMLLFYVIILLCYVMLCYVIMLLCYLCYNFIILCYVIMLLCYVIILLCCVMLLCLLQVNCGTTVSRGVSLFMRRKPAIFVPETLNPWKNSLAPRTTWPLTIGRAPRHAGSVGSECHGEIVGRLACIFSRATAKSSLKIFHADSSTHHPALTHRADDVAKSV